MNNTTYEGETNVHKRVQNAKAELPYQFLQINPSDAVVSEIIPFDREKGKSGSIKCTLQVLNALIVGNEHIEQDDISSIHPLKITTNTDKSHYFISSYTLKSCIRQFVASFNNIPMRQVENEAFFYRPNQYFQGNQKLGLAAGIVDTISSGGGFTASLFPPDFYFGNEQNFMINSSGELISDFSVTTSYKIVSRKIVFTPPPAGSKTAKFAFFHYRDGIDGNATFSELFGNRKSHKVLGVKKPSTHLSVTASASTVEQYNQLPELIAEYHLANHPNLTVLTASELSDLKSSIKRNWEIKKGDLILYEYDTLTNQILSMGKHFRYLWSYTNRIRDYNEVCMVDVENFKKDRLWITDEMFGYSFSKSQKDHIMQESGFDIEEKENNGTPKYDTAKSGKVHFNFAKHVHNTGKIVTDIEIPGAGSPRPSSYEFYLQQDYDKEQMEPLNNYGDRLAGSRSNLSGRKIYRRSLNYQKNIDAQKKEANFTQKLKVVFKSETDHIAEFKFTVNFQNLGEDELNQLLFALTLGNNDPINDPRAYIGRYCHQIGYGKNYGMGAVKINIDEIRTCCLENDTLRETIITDRDKMIKEVPSLADKLEKNTDFDAMKLTDDTFSYPKDYSYESNGTHRIDDRGQEIFGVYSWHGKVRETDHKNRKARY